jgi:hypothetical protein
VRKILAGWMKNIWRGYSDADRASLEAKLHAVSLMPATQQVGLQVPLTRAEYECWRVGDHVDPAPIRETVRSEDHRTRTVSGTRKRHPWQPSFLSDVDVRPLLARRTDEIATPW